MSAEIYAEMANMGVDIVAPFLIGTENYPQDQVVDEVFALKPLVDSLGAAEVKKLVTKFASEGKHDEIIPRLMHLEQHAAHSAHGDQSSHGDQDGEGGKGKKGSVFGWLFKGKDKSSEEEKKEKELEKEREREKRKERDREKELAKEKEEKEKEKVRAKHMRSGSKQANSEHTAAPQHHHGHHDPENPSPNASLSTVAMPLDDGTQIPPQAPPPQVPPPLPPAQSRGQGRVQPNLKSQPPAPGPRGRGLPFNPQFSSEEAAAMGEYNFQSQTSRSYTMNDQPAETRPPPKDDDFDAIFRQFMGGGPAK